MGCITNVFASAKQSALEAVILGMPSVSPSTPILHDTTTLRRVVGFQWNLAEIFTT